MNSKFILAWSLQLDMDYELHMNQCTKLRIKIEIKI